MNPRHCILATAGHVDHGKSALVQALTGTDPDRLPEEKRRGITIELGFAHLDLPPRPETPGAPALSIGIVDVPGHVDFVRNMVTGVGSIDAALLVVAADGGWMPQTEEHLQILLYLGISRAVIALSRVDLAGPDRAAETESEIRRQILGTPLVDAPLVRTSVLTGSGVDELKIRLRDVLEHSAPQADIGKPRLPVDRTFQLRGTGIIVTGTLTGGRLERGQTIAVAPGGGLGRVRALQSHHRDVGAVDPGMRAAINLPDFALAEFAPSNPNSVSRGSVITLPQLARPADVLDVHLFRSPRLRPAASTTDIHPLKHGTRVRIHHGTANVPARILLLDAGDLEAGNAAIARLRLEAPLPAFLGDRFIVRDWPEEHTLAGGIVLDPDAAARRFRTPAQRAFLEHRAADPLDPLRAIQSLLQRDRIVPRDGLLDQSPFSENRIIAAVENLFKRGMLIRAADCIVEAAFWGELFETAAGAIDDFHNRQPEQPGLPLTGLRSLLRNRAFRPAVMDALLDGLTRNGFTRTGTAIRRANHRMALPPDLREAGDRVRAALLAHPHEPPTRKALAPDSASRQALEFLIRNGEVVPLGADLLLAAEAFHGMTESIVLHLRNHGRATVSELRQALGTTRRVMVPLLEHLDHSVTLREGDHRVLRPAVGNQ
ncbi:MAG TPA: selenocysteine-specific translation elongation factor, partial [Methylomirabilota bacterium]|nr:selenocysteine-specific translation elongation factor [Methylomirabilota bacterium]